jgi:hypothetical protein
MRAKALSFISLVTLVLAIASGRTNAQKTSIYTFDTVDSIRGSSSFCKLKVIDNRAYKADLGTLETVRKKKLVTGKEFPEVLVDFADRVLRNAVKASDTLLLVLHDFRVETVAKDEYSVGTFYFRGQFFLGQNNSYKLLYDIDSFYEVGGNNITNETLVFSDQKVFSYFKQIAELDARTISGRAFTESEAISYLADAMSVFPIYKTSSFRKGVYRTFDDFLNHQPEDRDFIQRDHFVTIQRGRSEKVENRPTFFYRTERDKKGERIDSVFAIFTGKEWFQPHKEGWVRLRFENGDFYSSRYYKGIVSTPNSAAMIGTGAMFGLAGMAIAVKTGLLPMETSEGVCLYETRLDPIKRKFLPVRRM